MMCTRLFCLLWLVFAAVVVPSQAAEKAISEAGARVGVIDGDTLEIRGHVIQLYGIDAPELGQICMKNGEPWQCGLEAAFTLRKIVTVEHATVLCRPWGATGAVLTAVCEAGPIDLAHSLISSGHAVVLAGAFPDYAERQHDAKEAGLGLWRGKFVPPAAWRQGGRLPGEESLRSDIAACAIKAVFDSGGRKVYFVPTDRGFRSLRVHPERGERCFWSDDHARAAGWKRESEFGADPPARQ